MNPLKAANQVQSAQNERAKSENAEQKADAAKVIQNIWARSGEASKLELVENEETKSASNLNLSQLTDLNKSASLLADKPELLAGLNAKSAGKLADLSKSASRTEAQQLADLRQRKGDRVQIAIRVRGGLKKAIDVFMATQEMSQQDFFELAASQFMENYEKRLADLSNKSASKLAIDDRRMILYKTKPTIINLYLAYNPRNRWTPKDDEIAAKFNDLDLRIIECAIVATQENAKFKRIHSFSYYKDEIESYSESNPSEQILSHVTESSRRVWQTVTGQTLNLSFTELD